MFRVQCSIKSLFRKVNAATLLQPDTQPALIVTYKQNCNQITVVIHRDLKKQHSNPEDKIGILSEEDISEVESHSI